ncbi:MAG: hypothetical protein ACFB10_00950 [Salibacteraceae bacterium]
MASAFWTFEDGRGFAKRWTLLSHLLKLITDEMESITGAEDFYTYLEKLVFREEQGHIPNGLGGFYNDEGCILLNLDLRSFTPQNQGYFWKAMQRALWRQIVVEQGKNEWIIYWLTQLLDMHKRIKRRENPAELNFYDIIQPPTDERLGPGW